MLARYSRLTRVRKVIVLGVGLSFLDYIDILPGQRSADLHAIAKGFTNSAVALPIISSCVYDYIHSLKKLDYPSD
jgi:hypothetical protein